MKKVFLLLALPIIALQMVAQNVSINTTGAAPHTSAMLDVNSTTKGFLIPRMTTGQRIAIAAPATGLQVFDTDNNSFWFYNGTIWVQLTTGSNGWNLTGNTGTNPATHFIGTTDNQPLRFRVNNVWAGEINSINSNVFFGLNTGNATATGINNTAIGNRALFSNTTGYLNTASGSDALYSNTIGYINTASGDEALYSNTIGFSNIANGYRALYSNTTGQRNIAIGSGALFGNIGGSNNIAIGSGTGTGGPDVGSLYNTIGIGNDGGFLNGASNQAIIGNESMVFIGGKVPWSVVSDERVKNNIVEDVVGLNFILKLRPVTYLISSDAITIVSGNMKTSDFPGKYDGDKIKYTGFLAQEVEKAAKAANYNFSGYSTPKTVNGLYTLSYEQFVVPLVKAMQEQQQVIEEQSKKIKKQAATIESLEKRLSALEAKSLIK